jgi:hypothetical protein
MLKKGQFYYARGLSVTRKRFWTPVRILEGAALR